MQRQPNNRIACACLASALLLSGCSVFEGASDLLGAESRQEKALPGERIAVLSYQNELREDTLLEDSPIRMIQPLINSDFLSETELQQAGIENVKISGYEPVASVSVGDGTGWETRLVAQPVVAENVLYAVDAAGVVSAHNAENIEEVLWRKPLTHNDELMEIEGGGLAYAGGVLYVTTGYGSVVALVASNGSVLWRQETGTPIRSAPAVADNQLFTITIENELLAYGARTGQPLWSHRGIRESAVYLGDVTPVIENGIVVASYSSGELYAMRAEDGTPLWSDNLIATKRTSASSALTGIDATPLISGNVIYALSNNGLMVANVLSNGRGVWDAELSGHHTPWIAGNYLFVLTSDMQLLAMQAREKRIKWKTDLTALVDEADDLPMFTSPMLLNSQLALTGNRGEIWLFEPTDGSLIQRVDITDGVLSAPVTSNGNLYLINQDAQLYQYR